MPITYEKPYSYQPFQWTPEMTKELQTVVEQLKGNRKLFYPSFNQGFNLYTDGSAWGLGWFLTQGKGKDEDNG